MTCAPSQYATGVRRQLENGDDMCGGRIEASTLSSGASRDMLSGCHRSVGMVHLQAGPTVLTVDLFEAAAPVRTTRRRRAHTKHSRRKPGRYYDRS